MRSTWNTLSLSWRAVGYAISRWRPRVWLLSSVGIETNRLEGDRYKDWLIQCKIRRRFSLNPVFARVLLTHTHTHTFLLIAALVVNGAHLFSWTDLVSEIDEAEASGEQSSEGTHYDTESTWNDSQGKGHSLNTGDMYDDILVRLVGDSGAMCPEYTP